MSDYPRRIRLRVDLMTHAARLVPGTVTHGAGRTIMVDYDQTACGTTITTPEADNGCVYLDPSQSVTCRNCQTVISLS